MPLAGVGIVDCNSDLICQTRTVGHSCPGGGSLSRGMNTGVVNGWADERLRHQVDEFLS